MVIYYRHWQIYWRCDRWIVGLMGNCRIISFWIDAISMFLVFGGGAPIAGSFLVLFALVFGQQLAVASTIHWYCKGGSKLVFFSSVDSEKMVRQT